MVVVSVVGRMNGNGHGDALAMDRSSIMLSQEQISELAEVFNTIDLNGDGQIQLSELQLALKTVGLDLPGYEVRELVERYRKTSSGDSLTFWEFSELYKELREKKDFGHKFKKSVKAFENVKVVGGMTESSNEDILHSVRNEEQVAFSDWINTNLTGDADLRNHLPISVTDDSLYQKVDDGLVICKLINLAVPETIDERAINKKKLSAYTKRENLTLALNSAQAIGCNIVNIDADDLAKGKPHLVLGLLWQIIRIGLFNQIDLIHVPGLVRLLQEGETLADLQKLSPEQILVRWVNYHLANADTNRRLANFTSDIQDSEIYSHLLHQIAPKDSGVSLHPLSIHGDNLRRAGAMLGEADKLGCKAFVTPKDVSNGVYKLNLAFVANLFNSCPGLKPPGEDEDLGDLEGIEETREEKTYRNWMNSMGVDPHVNWLYSDLANGLVIFQLYDIIRPGLVDWKKVTKKFRPIGGMMDQIMNGNYAVDLGKQLRFSLVGIQGKDLYDGNRTLTLALVWQLMRAYTLSVLAQCTESGDRLAADKDILNWVNQKLSGSGKGSSIKSFQDPSIANGKAVIDLIDAIKPGTIDYSLVKDPAASHEDKLGNAKYAITVARKLGAKVYALPEDIVEVKPKMVMTVFACLMARDFMPSIREGPADSPTTLSPS